MAPYTIVEREDQIPAISQAYRQARTMNRPYVVAFTRRVLRGGD